MSFYPKAALKHQKFKIFNFFSCPFLPRCFFGSCVIWTLYDVFTMCRNFSAEVAKAICRNSNIACKPTPFERCLRGSPTKIQSFLAT